MTSFGMKNMRTTSKSQIIIFAIQPPWCHESRLSLWSFTPIIMRASIPKKRKFPKLTRRTACIWNHAFVCEPVFIPIIRYHWHHHTTIATSLQGEMRTLELGYCWHTVTYVCVCVFIWGKKRFNWNPWTNCRTVQATYESSTDSPSPTPTNDNSRHDSTRHKQEQNYEENMISGRIHTELAPTIP